jgi:pimeloyl-ACP methyl ester carboxylesterase
MLRRWRGLKALIHDAVDRTTELVEEGHESVSRSVVGVLSLAPPLAEPARTVDEVRRLTTRGVLGTIRAVNRAVEAVTDVGLDVAEHVARSRGAGLSSEAPVGARSDATGSARWIGDAALGLVNGAIGDHLHMRKNGLDLGMQLRHGDGYLDLDAPAIDGATPKLAVLVHGLSTTEWSWWLESEAYHGDPSVSFGSLLARDLGYTPIYVRYNTGRHVSENGRMLARELERLVTAYPGALDEVLLVGHSMGGLVARSACWYAEHEGLTWPRTVRRVVCLGSPHHGAPLEKLGHAAATILAAIDTPGTRISARLIEGRSAGIKDLRHGALVDEDWHADPGALTAVPLLEHASYHFLSATLTRDPAHPVGQLIGDLLVRAPSASGALIEARTFPIETRCFGGVLHHQIQNHPAVYEELRRACAE